MKLPPRVYQMKYDIGGSLGSVLLIPSPFRIGIVLLPRAGIDFDTWAEAISA